MAANKPPAAAGSGSANLPEDKNLQLYSKHHTNVFDSLRKSIKKEGDMFLFGEPTDKMMKLLLKIYHENILRVFSEAESKKFKCMFGILQDSDDNLYVTISESSGRMGDRRTNAEYDKKKDMMLILLKSANVEIQFPERGAWAAPAPDRWRKGVSGGDNWDTIPLEKSIRRQIETNKKVKSLTGEELGVKDVMFYTPAQENGKDDNINLYDPSLRALPMEVNWVDSEDYLRDRAAGKPTFRPFKKYTLSSNGKTWRAECNNGHLCTESKLFAYAFKKGLRVKSFVAYWIGSAAPPEQHIMKKYCYRTVAEQEKENEEVADEIQKLNRLTDRCTNVLDDDRIKAIANFYETFRSTIQPIAVACPGCFANIQAYLQGDMVTWNTSNCYVNRKGVPGIGGGTHKRKHRKSHKTRKPKRRA